MLGWLLIYLFFFFFLERKNLCHGNVGMGQEKLRKVVHYAILTK